MIDHHILKSTFIWYWRHVKGHQDDQTGPLDRWASLNVECDTAEKYKWKEDQKTGFPETQYQNIQDEKCRLFISVPTTLDRKRNTALGYKFCTNLKPSIYNTTFKKPLLYLWQKIDTLYEIYHTRVDWEAIKLATKESPSR